MKYLYPTKKRCQFILSFLFIQFYLIAGYSQSVTVSDKIPGESPTYTFTYVTTGEIGQGSTTPNIFYMRITPGFPVITNTIDDSNLLGSNIVLKVNGSEKTIDATTFGTAGGAWSGGIQMSISGGSSGLTIPAGATIEVIVTGIIINPPAGDYIINWKTATGTGAAVESYSDTVNFSTLSINDHVKPNLDVTLYPNPFNEILNIDVSSNSKIVIIDLQGKNIVEKEIDKGISQLDLSSIRAGVYILKIEDRSNNTITYKKIVRK